MSDELYAPPKDKTCAKCQQRPATTWWTAEGTIALVHGFYEARCEVCCLEEQLENARRLAASIPEMEARLAALKAQAAP